MMLKFSQKFNHPILHVFLFGIMFPESHSFVAMPVTSYIKDTFIIYPYQISEGQCYCSTL